MQKLLTVFATVAQCYSGSCAPGVPSRVSDLTGQKFGRLTATGYAGRDAHGKTRWTCECECGTTTVVRRSHLLTGNTTSCGCRRTDHLDGPRKAVELAGMKFGALTVIERSGADSRGNIMWACECECGRETVARGGHLRSGNTSSCGCRRRSNTAGANGPHLYRVWNAMVRRCHNPNATDYAYYGARGIEVCLEWRESFDAFYRDMVPTYRERLTLDRIDVNGPYSLDNCRWATRTEQARNTRRNRLLTFRGQTKSLAEWCELLELNYATVRSRLVQGWSVERAFTVPVRSRPATNRT